MPPSNTRLPLNSPFDDPARHNRELEARRQSEASAGRAEAEILARKKFEEIQKQANLTPDFPKGFSLPPVPTVGDVQAAHYPHGKMPVMPPPDPNAAPFLTDAEIIARRLQDEADMLADIERQAQQAQQPAPGTRQAPVSKIKAKAKVSENPILKQLRLDLGIDTHHTIDLTIADHMWSFYPLSPEMTTLALRIAEMGSTADLERELLQQYAAVCCSVVAIDHEPLWKVFSIEPEKDDDISFPLMPKGRIRQRAALSLLQELMTNAKLGIMQALLEAYNSEVDPTGVVKGFREYSKDNYYRFNCPVEGCTFHIVRSKRYDTANNELAYFCELHGEALDGTPVGNPKGGLNPLG